MGTGPIEVAYLGPEASYTHQAALKAFPSSPISPHPTIVSIFEAVRASSKETYGVVPVENSTNGPVAATLDQLTLPDTSNCLRIVGEVRVPVRHCLLGARRQHGRETATQDGRKALSSPTFGKDQLPNLSNIKQLYTHPQAWGQCTKFLKALGLSPPGAKPVSTASALTNTENTNPSLQLDITCHDATSTSSAAALAAADKSGGTAAISSHLAAEAHGAEILLDRLEDSSTNVTRFLIIQPQSQTTPSRLPHLTDAKVRRKALVTFILTPTRDGSPGGLSDALGVFAKQQLSLTSINARPKGGEVAFEYTFIVEMDLEEGTAVGAAPLDKALEELQGVVALSTCLGTWLWKVDD